VVKDERGSGDERGDEAREEEREREWAIGEGMRQERENVT